METLEAIYTRRSVRMFEKKQIEKETIEKILDAAVQAPTAMNQQIWAFSIVQNLELLNKLSERIKKYQLDTITENPEFLKYKDMFQDPEYNVFYQCPTLVTIYTKKDIFPSYIDCALAAENMMLAAHSMDLGTCWIGLAINFLNLPEIKKEFGVPEEYQVVAPIIVGYPKMKMDVVEKMKPEIVFWKE